MPVGADRQERDEDLVAGVDAAAVLGAHVEPAGTKIGPPRLVYD